MTTNATLLTPGLIDYFDAHRFGISVSMDGPKAIHDRHRKSVGGQGDLRCGGPQGAAAARALSLAAGGRASDVGRRHHRGGGDSRAFARARSASMRWDMRR